MPFPRLRFAPSPTGFLHLGNLRAALFNWLFAQKMDGTFILRLDDTDTVRTEERYVTQILEDLRWLGLSPQETVRQSERQALYEKHIEILKKSGRLYPCFETPEELEAKREEQGALNKPPRYDRGALALSEAEKEHFVAEGRHPHWRFRLEEGVVAWDDLMRGPLAYATEAVSDPVVVREDGRISFLLAGAIDDVDLGITHIIRGEDHITNTAIQIQMMTALGKTMPDSVLFGHFSLVGLAGGEALSKRSGSMSLHALRQKGMHPMALLSYLSSLGTAQGAPLVEGPKELIDNFDLKGFGRSSAQIDFNNLESVNRRFLQGLSFEAAQSFLDNHGLKNISQAFWNVCQGSFNTVEDIRLWQEICEGVEPVVTTDNIPSVLRSELLLETLPSTPWDDNTWTAWMKVLLEKESLEKRVLFPAMRRLLTGQRNGPEMRLLFPLLKPGHVKEILKKVGK